MAIGPERTAPQQSLPHALRVLEALTRHPGGVTGAHLARETGLSPEHLGRLLRMLCHEDYALRVGDGAYVAGEALDLLSSSGDRPRALRAKLQRSLDGLRDSLGAAVYLSRYIDGEVRITQYADGPHTPKVHEWVDFRSAAHASALGKCLLGQLDHDGRRDHLARHRTPRLTSRTITSARLLCSRLDTHPATVPVLDLQEYAVGTVCAAVPITAGDSAGALALSLPLDHAHRLRHAAEALNRRATPLLLSLAL
ncbi:IclR family transcriptional regulator [Streptomyces gamaensis]|uniref:IclR family transcriptional regulator n=1 Tax=Streptomyces gamaensis TaxID=1763542 RepID=A0ABW0YV18_9ACTN